MDFISIKEALLALASCVPVPGHVTNRAKSDEAHQIATYREELYRLSCAAADLEQALTNTMRADRPRWLDKRNPMGRPRAVEEAALDGVPQLQEWAGFFVEWDHEYQSNRWHGQWNPDGVLPAEFKFFNLSNLERVQGVGFDRTELVLFLNRHRLPHSLGDVHCAEQSDPASNPPSVDESVAKSEGDGGESTKKRRQYRGDLANVLRMAENLVSDRDDHHAVWDALVGLAMRETPPRPLKGFTGDGVKWADEDEEPQLFTKENLRRRMRHSDTKNDNSP